MSEMTRSIGLFTALLLMAATASAEWSLDYGSASAISMEFARTRSGWSAAGVARTTRYSELGASYYEIYGSLTAGLHGGYLDLSQQDNPATVGLMLGGYYVGVSAQSGRALAPSTELLWRLSYTYRNASDETTQQITELEWHDWNASLAVSYRLNNTELSAGAMADVIEGDETASGSVSHTRSFRHDRTGSGTFAIKYWVDDTGSIRLNLAGGARREAQLVFAREF
ncbi:MAG: hypothetical protein A2V90_02685 [Gammaproteobacteria bacterium RBG_16_57_12]|nr:MAG: hypothetical protein A2V90_02685 [Gammaproteobacteria bacterium RBG_16_57_12]